MSFDGVVGQATAVAALEAQLARSGGAGSTLIVGPEGVGRFLLAQRAARAVLGTTSGAAARVDTLQHADLYVLTPGDGIDGVRRARESLVRKPSEGARNFLLVRDADHFSNEALNALLKTLEEPPADAAVFLVAESAAALPETVLSRCRVVAARALTDAETAQVLERAGVAATPAAVAAAEGSPGRAVEHAAQGTLEDADRLAGLLLGTGVDPLAEADRLARRKPGEEARVHRRRLTEVLRVTAARLRRELPATENVLRSVVEGIGSLAGNANPGIVFAHLAIDSWTKRARN